jgi:hypothetical protein
MQDFLVPGPLKGAREVNPEGRGGIGKTGEAMRKGKEGTDSQRRLRLLFRSIVSTKSKISRSCAPYVLKRACMCGRAGEQPGHVHIVPTSHGIQCCFSG